MIRLLWLGVALTLPSFGVSFYRLELGGFSFAPPMMFMVAIAYLLSLAVLQNRGLLNCPFAPGQYATLAVVVGVFVVWHFVSLAIGPSSFLPSEGVPNLSEHLRVGLKEALKIFAAFACFWLTLVCFPRDEKFIARFFVLACFSCAAILAVLIYKYAFIFHTGFLATELDYVDRRGKNQLALQVEILFFYALSYFSLNRRKITAFLPLGVIVVALIYLGSRMAWISTAVGMAYTLYFVWRRNPRIALRLTVWLVFGVTVMAVVGFMVLSQFVDVMEMATRFRSIYDPLSIPEGASADLGRHSYELRGRAIYQAWAGFLTSPILGVGLANTYSFVERLTHNDYATILLELGAVGIIVFGGVLIAVWRKGQPAGRLGTPRISWLSLAARGSFVAMLVSLNFYNFYLAVYFWFYLALFVVTVETVEGSPASMDATVQLG